MLLPRIFLLADSKQRRLHIEIPRLHAVRLLLRLRRRQRPRLRLLLRPRLRLLLRVLRLCRNQNHEPIAIILIRSPRPPPQPRLRVADGHGRQYHPVVRRCPLPVPRRRCCHVVAVLTLRGAHDPGRAHGEPQCLHVGRWLILVDVVEGHSLGHAFLEISLKIGSLRPGAERQCQCCQQCEFSLFHDDVHLCLPTKLLIIRRTITKKAPFHRGCQFLSILFLWIVRPDGCGRRASRPVPVRVSCADGSGRCSRCRV